MILIPATASASLNGKEDFSEPRIVAISLSSSVGSSPWANGSGYLYSPRIVFSAGHIKDNDEYSQIYVSQPNQKLKQGMQVAKVIKKYFPATYKKKIYRDDFAILVLEKPLADVKKAPLITPELLSQAISSKIPMKNIGFGAYQDVCLEMKVKAPCQFGSDRTSLVPRSIEVMPWNASEIKSKYGRYDEEVSDHLFLTGPYKSGGCPGDSGGSTNVSIGGISYYVGTSASGFWNAYACGQSGGEVGDTIGYTAPVFKFLEMIAEAERYVAEHPFVPAKATVAAKPTTPNVSSQYQYILKLSQSWARFSKPADTALKQCTSARDKGVINKNGKAVSIGTANANLARDLKRYPGFNACLAGFMK
jgi:hypothetical protein